MEFTGKNVEKAIENGLKELNKTREEVKITVISEGGLFSKAKILMEVNEKEDTKSFVKDIFAKEEPVVEECKVETEEVASACECGEECHCGEHCECGDDCDCEECSTEEEIYELETEDGHVVPAALLDTVSLNEKEYCAFEALENDDDIEAGDFIVLEKVLENDELKLLPVEDETIIDEVFDIVSKKFEVVEECSGECSCCDHEVGCECEHCEDEEVEEKPAREYMSSEDVYETIQEFFANVFKTLNIDAKVMILENDEAYEVKIMGDEKVASLIGYRGEGLNAYQLILNSILALRNKSKKIYLDVENYRNKREESLKALAVRIARKVLKTKRKHKFEPMTAYERHIIHEELSNFVGVETHSEGNEPHRCLVVDIKKD